ncbi:MAG: dockerin type I repeat-containing protein, partial [Ruminococcus sp.]|nr:dockerin type I repeat-containing protein [Ruminococcus sp.]
VKNLVYGLDIDRNLVKDYGETLINNKFISGEFNDYEYKLSMLRLSNNLQNVFDKITSEYTNYFYLPSDWKCSGKQNPIAVWTDDENYYNLTMQDTDYENIYGVEFPEEAETVVFTNGGFKDDRCETIRIRITDYESDNTIYILGYTTDMIYVLNSEKSTDKLKCVGDWYYLYDDGKYGFCSLREDAEKNNQVFAGEYQNEDNMSDVSYARLSKEIKQSLIEKFYTGADESSIDIKFIWDIGDSHRTYLFVHRFSGKKQSNIFLTEEFDDYSFTYPECREPMVMVDGELYRIVDAYKHIPFSDNEIVNLKFNLDEVAYINNRILGDVNGDNALNINDATLLQKYLVGLDDIGNDFVCDVNDDLVVDIKDVTEMQKIIVGLA